MSFKAPSETDLVALLRQWLDMHGAKSVRVNSGGMPMTDAHGKKRFVRFNSEPGCADLLVCFKGRFIAIEAKMPGSRTDPKRAARQKQFGIEVEMAGGIYLRVESLDELQADLREAGLLT